MEKDRTKAKAYDRSGNTPLHLLFIGISTRRVAPEDMEEIVEVIQFLVNTWPDSIHATDNYGFIPLHHACYFNAPLEVIQFMLHVWPASVLARDKTRESIPQIPQA